MESGFDESTGRYCSGNTNKTEISDFECNICFELAEDPIVTLCGHLYCWPCLYKWLCVHSHSHECPLCKALIREEKLVPIYGRGKSVSNPRSRSIPGVVDIPNRPAGRRPIAAPLPAPAANYLRRDGNQLMGGFPPPAGGTARVRNLTLSAGFGSLFPSVNFQVHGFNYANAYGAATGFPYSFPGSLQGGHAHGFHHRLYQGQQRDSLLKIWFLFVWL